MALLDIFRKNGNTSEAERIHDRSDELLEEVNVDLKRIHARMIPFTDMDALGMNVSVPGYWT